MSWPVRSKRLGLYNATPAANTFVLLGTVPAGKVWLVKEWGCYNAGASTRDVAMCIRIGAVVTVWDIAKNVPSANPNGNPNRHFVMNAGEELGFQTTTAQALQVTVSGAQLG